MLWVFFLTFSPTDFKTPNNKSLLWSLLIVSFLSCRWHFPPLNFVFESSGFFPPNNFLDVFYFLLGSSCWVVFAWISEACRIFLSQLYLAAHLYVFSSSFSFALNLTIEFHFYSFKAFSFRFPNPFLHQQIQDFLRSLKILFCSKSFAKAHQLWPGD